MEMELQAYKQKVDQMTVLLKHYQNELESQKVRRDGVETVSRLLAESRQENVALKKNMIAMETTMKNLKNRLVVNGLCPNAESDDNEVIVPGTSKQTLTNLAMENKRLRSMLQHDPSNTDSVNESDSLQKTAKVTETEQSLQQTVDKLQVENKSMKMKLSDLEHLYRSSNNEKDRQLLSLQEEVEQLRQKSGKEGEPTKTVAGLPALKEQLREFMSRCEDFDSALDQMQETSSAQREITGVELTPIDKQAVERTEGDAVDGANVTQLLEEKQKLQDRVEEVTKMNQRWQEFFNDRERYTQSLEQRVQELDERLKEAMRMGPSQEINRRIEQVLEKSQKEISHMDELRQKAEDEVQLFRQELAGRDAQMAQLQNQVTILSQTSRQQHSSSEASSTIEHLKAQIQVCTEDFEKERQDRQVALQKVSSLQDETSRLRKLNAHLQTVMQSQQQAMQQAPASRPPAQEHGHDPHNLQPRGAQFRPPGFDFDYDCPRSPEINGGWRDYPDFDFESPGNGRSNPTAGPLSMPGTTMELIARGPQPKQPLSESALAPQTPKQNVLTCPKCNKEFSEERQGELLAHMDVCWE